MQMKFALQNYKASVMSKVNIQKEMQINDLADLTQNEFLDAFNLNWASPSCNCLRDLKLDEESDRLDVLLPKASSSDERLRIYSAQPVSLPAIMWLIGNVKEFSSAPLYCLS